MKTRTYLIIVTVMTVLFFWIPVLSARDFNHDLIWHGYGFAVFSTVAFIPDKIMLDDYEMKSLHRILGLTTIGVAIELVDLKESGEFSWGDIGWDLGGIASGYLITKGFKQLSTRAKIYTFILAGTLIYKYSE